MKEFVRKMARKAGYEITRYSPETNYLARLLSCMAAHHVATVIDVGANIGQFALGVRRAGFNGRIISIEPQREAHIKLVRNAAKDRLADWHVLPRVAVGESTSELDLRIAGNSASSSMLPMLATHSDAMPSSREVRVERIQVRRLDDLLVQPGVDARPPLLVKMDVQ